MSALSKLFNVTVTVTVANEANSDIFFTNYVQVGDGYWSIVLMMCVIYSAVKIGKDPPQIGQVFIIYQSIQNHQ